MQIALFHKRLFSESDKSCTMGIHKRLAVRDLSTYLVSSLFSIHC
jgi:hypothetical protein